MRILGVVLVMACGAGEPKTEADACYELGSTYCGRLNACGLLTTTAAVCAGQFTSGCCSGGDCSRAITTTKFIDECNSDLGQLSCGDIAGGLLPNVCVAQADAGK